MRYLTLPLLVLLAGVTFGGFLYGPAGRPTSQSFINLTLSGYLDADSVDVNHLIVNTSLGLGAVPVVTTGNIQGNHISGTGSVRTSILLGYPHASGDILIDPDSASDGTITLGQAGDADNITCAADAHFHLPQRTDAGPMTATAGTEGEIVYNTSDSKVYVCTTTGTPATWAALN